MNIGSMKIYLTKAFILSHSLTYDYKFIELMKLKQNRDVSV